MYFSESPAETCSVPMKLFRRSPAITSSIACRLIEPVRGLSRARESPGLSMGAAPCPPGFSSETYRAGARGGRRIIARPAKGGLPTRREGGGHLDARRLDPDRLARRDDHDRHP